MTLPRYERYVAAERDGFVALIDASSGGLRLFGQAGYLLGDGIGVLVERGPGKSFVWHDQSVAATPELLAVYDRFRRELRNLLNAQ